MDQGNQALERRVFAPSTMSPMRAVLLLLGAVLGGVVLSLLLSASPAQAAEGNGSGSGLDDSLGSVSGVAVAAIAPLSSAGDEIAPLVHHVVHATANSGIAIVPAAAPVVAPLAVAVDAALTATADLVAPLTGKPIVGPQHVAPPLPRADSWLAPSAGGQPGVDLPTIADQGLGTPGGDTTGSAPSPILSAGSAAPAAVLAVLPTIIGVALPGSRRHLDDDALPASPTFETDTSPA